MTVILKNPSSADEKAADNTINRVENYVFKNFQDVLKVNILNLFAIRATDAVEVNDVYKATGKEDVVGPENDQSFEKYIKEADYIITAWGGRSQINRKLYDSRIKEVLEILKKSKKEMTPIYRVNPKKGSVHYPFHACFWSVFFEKEFVDVNILNSLE